MRKIQLAVSVWMVLLLASCASFGQRRPHSVGGTVEHGGFVTVPWGTVNDWNIVVTPMQMGVEETGSEEDNRLLAIRVSAAVQNETAWQVTALYRFAYANNNTNVHWVEGSANYLLVRKYSR